LETIVIGEITSVYGIKGWLKLKSWTEPQERIFAYQPWLISDAGSKQTEHCDVIEYRDHSGQYVIRLDGVNDRDSAAKYTKKQVVIDKSRLPTLPDNEYYWADLKGMRVYNLTGNDFGVVSHLLETGANDVLVINGDRQRLVPFIRGQVVTDVNQSTATITVDWDADFE